MPGQSIGCWWRPAGLASNRMGHLPPWPSKQGQQHALAEAGCLRIFADKLSGKNADRPQLAACLGYLRPGDTLVVPSLDGYPGRWPT
jgi:hypothetical protein